MFGLKRKKLTKKEALEYIKDEVERYSFRFRLYCKDAYGTGRKIPRIEKVFFLRAKREILNLIDSPLSTVDEEYWLRLVNAFGFLRASFERITILASSRDVVRLPLCPEQLAELDYFREKANKFSGRKKDHLRQEVRDYGLKLKQELLQRGKSNREANAIIIDQLERHPIYGEYVKGLGKEALRKLLQIPKTGKERNGK